MKLKPNPMKTDQTKETRATAETSVYGSEEMLTPAPTEFIPQHKTTPEIAYRMVKDETYSQTQPRLNLATFVTTYMDDYATKLMNDAININYIDETEYPRVAVMCGRCINILANLWHTPEKNAWKAGAVGIGSSEACMLGGVAACQTQEGGQTLRQAQSGDECRLSDRVGEVLPAVADRAACRAHLVRASYAGCRGGVEDVRREHHLHRSHRRCYVDGP